MTGPRLGAVVLAGGRGSRLGELARDTPKPLLPLLGEPIIAWHLRLLAQVGIADVTISTGHLAGRFRPAVGDGSAYGVQVRYAVEDSPLGTGGGLRLAAASLPAQVDTVVVLNGDQLTEHDLAGQLAAHAGGGTLHVRPVADARAFGLVDVDATATITRFVEKPEAPGSGLVNAGSYVLDRSLIAELPPGPASLEREGFARWAREGRLRAFVDDAWTQDLGTPAGFIAAHQHLTGRDTYVERTARVDPSARLTRSVVLAGATVGTGARVTGSIVGPGAAVPPGAIVADAVVVSVPRRARTGRPRR